jgi:hypothetical protein
LRFKASLGKKLARPHLNKKLGLGRHIRNLTYIEAQVGGSRFQASQGKKQELTITDSDAGKRRQEH